MRRGDLFYAVLLTFCRIKIYGKNIKFVKFIKRLNINYLKV
jgi:hypothetical protein